MRGKKILASFFSFVWLKIMFSQNFQKSFIWVIGTKKRNRSGIRIPSIASTQQELGHRRAVGIACLFYRYVFGRCSSDISKLVPPFKISMRETRQSASAHRYTLRSTFWRTTSHESSFFPRATSVCNPLPDTCFPTVYSLQTFKSNVNVHLRVE